MEVIEGHAGRMTDPGASGEVTIFEDGKYFSSTLSCDGGQASSALTHNRPTALIKHLT